MALINARLASVWPATFEARMICASDNWKLLCFYSVSITFYARLSWCKGMLPHSKQQQSLSMRRVSCTHRCTRTCTRAHMCTYKHDDTQTITHMCTRTHTQMHTHMHACTPERAHMSTRINRVGQNRYTKIRRIRIRRIIVFVYGTFWSYPYPYLYDRTWVWADRIYMRLMYGLNRIYAVYGLYLQVVQGWIPSNSSPFCSFCSIFFSRASSYWALPLLPFSIYACVLHK